MKSRIEKEETRKEIKHLENFLKEIKARYEIVNDEVIIYGEIFESLYLDPEKWGNSTYLVEFRLNKENIVTFEFSKDQVVMDMWKGKRLITDMIERVKYVIVQKDRMYIIF